MSLQRNPSNINDLEDREILISFDPEATIGKYGLFGKNWHTAGIETDDGTFGLTRELNESTTVGAGFGVVSRSYKPGNVSSTVDLLEDNAVVRYIEWPDRAVDEGVNATLLLHSGKVAQGVVARVHKYNNGVVHIQVSREPAFLTIPERARGDAAAGKTLNIGYQPDGNKVIFEERYYTVVGGQVVELKAKRFVDDSEITAEGAYRVAGEGGKEIELEVIDETPEAEAEAEGVGVGG